MARFERGESPPSYSDYRRYLPFLRKDFIRQCAYCERTEEYLGGEESFEVEHFRPRSKFPELVGVYKNLYYVCRKCNAHKSEIWPTSDQAAMGFSFCDMTHVVELEDGMLAALTACGSYHFKHLRLDGRRDLQEWRRRRQARADLPYLERLAGSLEFLLSDGRYTLKERKEIAAQAELVRRHIEHSKRRFFLE